ncbi:unnamed protein product [Cercopithifilaria johnstoni]|uniref:BPTI/Kunitz inhibitor domain-containing protein n=1 Tax=Cercopithifilaria johnstoni TaxID=2874296 RepID=A0A8J2LPJ6_9BILA|nr:unnamed protein product [Cercopithifilaria johnstoni]
MELLSEVLHIYNNKLEIMLKSTVVLVLIKCIGSQEVLENQRCNHHPNRGTCEDRGFTIKWYYDRYAHRCREFYYGGCEGNENHFDSFEECSQACKYEPLDDSSKRCALPHDPGTCDNNFERWHFDMRKRQCVCSWWSGCGGNSNMFYSYAHCMSICGIYADNHTSATKIIFRRFIPESKSNQIHYVNDFTKSLLNKAVSLREGRQYRNLFATPSRDNGRKLLPRKTLRLVNVQNYQHRDPQLAKRYQYLQYNPSGYWRVISNRFIQEPRQKYSIRMMTRKHGHVSEPSDQRRWENMPTNKVQDYGQAEQSKRQTSYSRSQEIRGSQVISKKSPIRINQINHLDTTAIPSLSEDLRAKHIEAYIQQTQTSERSHAEALRERDRLIQQRRRDEYERAMKYEQELLQYQQTIQSMQNRVPQERAGNTDVWRQQQQVSSQRQYLDSVQAQGATFLNAPLPVNVRMSEEVRNTKLKHQRLSDSKKLKQIEKNRELLNTTLKPPQLRWRMQQQQQQQQHTEPHTEGFPLEIVFTADQVPDPQDVYVAETISAIPLPSEDFDQQKQMVTIEDYDEDENYTHDEETENEDQESSFLEHTPAEFSEGRWALTIAVQQPTSPSFTSRSIENPVDLIADIPKRETVIATTAATMKKRKESKTEISMIEIIPSKHDNEDNNVKVLDGKSEIEEDDNEIMFWQEQRQRKVDMR